MLRKRLLSIFLIGGLFHLNAQETYNVKLGIETGILPLSEDSENLGLFFNVEPKIKVLKNTFIGMRFGLAINSHTFENNNSFQYYIDERFDNAVLSFVPTVDYYLNENHFRPYAGLGLGYHLSPNPIEVIPIGTNPSEMVIEGSVNKRIGCLVRGGVELGKLRIGIEYNIIPKADIELPNDEVVGTVDNSYFGLSIGFMISVGKRSK